MAQLEVSPSAVTAPVASAAPSKRPLSLGETSVIWSSDRPAHFMTCDGDRLAWSGEGPVYSFRFGDPAPTELPPLTGVGALAVSGPDLFALRKGEFGIVMRLVGDTWTAASPELEFGDENLAASPEVVAWVAREGDEESLFVLEKRTGRIRRQGLPRTHWIVVRLVIDHDHVYLLAEDQLHQPHLYDAHIRGSTIAEIAPGEPFEDVGAADGVLVGLVHAPELYTANLVALDPPRTVLGDLSMAFHPSMVFGGGVACYFASDNDRHATVGCVDVAAGTKATADTFDSNWEFLAICGGQHLAWTRPAADHTWQLVQADIHR